jgi:hypothetical protein
VSSPEFARVVNAFSRDTRVTVGDGKGFGSGGLKVDGRLFAMISSRGQFVAKLPAQRVAELVAQGKGEPFDPGHGRLMREWIALGGGEADWLALAREARRFVGDS